MLDVFSPWLQAYFFFLISAAALVISVIALLFARWSLHKAAEHTRSLVMVRMQSDIMFDRQRYLADFARIEVTYFGQPPLLIRQIALLLPSGLVIDSVEWDLRNTSLPVTLGDGQTATFYMHNRAIRKALTEAKQAGECELTPICRDRSGAVHKGIPWILPQDDTAGA